MDFDQQLTVDLYVRADAPVPHRSDAVIDRLGRLEAEGRVSGFDVNPWPRAVSLGLADRTDEGGILRTVRSFERWADRNGLRIRPPFAVRSSRSRITGEADELLVLPVLCLAVYGDDGLIWVAPATAGESVVTVDDALDAIAAGEPPLPEFSTPDESRESDPDRERSGPTADADDPGSNAVGRVPNPTDGGD